MGVVRVEGKPVTVPDPIIEAGTEAIRAALSVDFPDLENAKITIDTPGRAPAVVTSRSASVVKTATPKG